MITKQNALGDLVTYNEPMFILVKGSDIYEGLSYNRCEN